MVKHGSYLVCKEYLKEVKEFLLQFFKEELGQYSHENWVTLIVPDTNFKVNLMKGNDQPITQNMTFEIYCESFEELKFYSHKFNKPIEKFLVTEVVPNYFYNYIEIPGPYNICKVEVNYCENIK